MIKVLVFCFYLTLSLTLAAVETNKRGGHGIFHGLEGTNGKTSWLEEPKKDSVKISKINTNSLVSNTNTGLKKSSLYLQPEPRGLEYLLNVPDQNPLLTNFYRRRRQTLEDATKNKVEKRQILLEPGNVIPGSRGQAVLYGFPNGSGLPNGFGLQPMANNQGIPIGPSPYTPQYPSGPNQNTAREKSVIRFG